MEIMFELGSAGDVSSMLIFEYNNMFGEVSK